MKSAAAIFGLCALFIMTGFIIIPTQAWAKSFINKNGEGVAIRRYDPVAEQRCINLAERYRDVHNTRPQYHHARGYYGAFQFVSVDRISMTFSKSVEVLRPEVDVRRYLQRKYRYSMNEHIEADKHSWAAIKGEKGSKFE